MIHHVVANGENLTAIAARYGATVAEVARANRLTNPDLLFAGEVLHVPEGAAEPVVATVSYEGAPYKQSIAAPQDLRPYWSADFVRMSSTFDEWPGVQRFNGFTRHWHKPARKGPGIEVNGFLGEQLASAGYRWGIHLERGWSWGGTKYGGKLGGLILGDNANGGDGPSETGGSVRLNWREDGYLRTYVYHADQPGTYGDYDLIDHQMPIGRDVELGLDVYVDQGRVVTFMDGQQIHDSGPGRFRWGKDVQISGVGQGIRFGGGSHEYGPKVACYSRFTGATLRSRRS